MNEELSYEKVKGISSMILSSLRTIKQYMPEMLSKNGSSALDAYNLINNATLSSLNKSIWRDNLERIIIGYTKYSMEEAYGIKLDSHVVEEIRMFVEKYLY